MCPQHCGSLSLSYDFWAAVRWRPMPKTGSLVKLPHKWEFQYTIPPPSPPNLPLSLIADAPQSQPHVGPSITSSSQGIPGWFLDLFHWEEFPLSLSAFIWLLQRGLNIASYWSVHKVQVLTNTKGSKPACTGRGTAAKCKQTVKPRIYYAIFQVWNCLKFS